MPVEEITQETADAVIEDLLSEAKMFVVTKDSLPIELAFRVIFDGARIVGVRGLPSGAQAYGGYFQGLGPVLLAPKGWKALLRPKGQVQLVAHEGDHGGQAYADPKFAIWYVQHTETRALYEAEAYGTGVEIEWACTGQIPARVEDLPHAMREGYALTSGDLELAQGLLEQRATSTVNGVIATRLGRLAIRRLYQLQPRALHPDAVARILAGSPGLLS